MVFGRPHFLDSLSGGTRKMAPKKPPLMHGLGNFQLYILLLPFDYVENSLANISKN